MKKLIGAILLGILFLLLCVISIPCMLFSNKTLPNQISKAIDLVCDKYFNNEEDSIS